MGDNDYYKMHDQAEGGLPYRWMAIEALQNPKFTKQTDVVSPTLSWSEITVISYSNMHINIVYTITPNQNIVIAIIKIR